MDLSDLKQAIYDLVKGSQDDDNVLVIWANQPAPRPFRPYITMNITSLVAIGDAEYRPQAAAGDYLISGPKKLLLSLNAYGPNALGVMHDVETELSREAPLDTLYVAGLSVATNSEIRNLSELVDTAIQERAQLDITLLYSLNESDTLNYIDDVELVNSITSETQVIES